MLNTIFVQPFLNLLFFIYGVIPGHDFGISVIIMTLILRFALWPLTAKQLHSQKKLQALQPDISKIKEKSKGDKQLESQMLMELYKEREISPFSACLPLLLQFPFLIALYFVFQSSIHDVQNISNQLYPFVKNLTFIQNLIQNPSQFNPTLLGFVSMAKPSVVFAVIAGLTQYVQVAMLTPKQEPTATKDPQVQMTKTMNIMFPFITVFIAYRLPAALPLYWTVTNIISIAQQKFIISGEVEKMEEVKIVKKIAQPKKSRKK